MVGSQIDTEEQIFAAFDGRIMRRFWGLSAPIGAGWPGRARRPRVRREPDRDPLVLRTVIDEALVKGADHERLLTLGVLVFFGIVTFNFLANSSRRRSSRASRSGC